MPFFGKKKKKKKPDPPQRADTTRLSVVDNIYETSTPISSSKRKGHQTFVVSGQTPIHSNNTSATHASNNSQVPTSNRSSARQSAPRPPPRTVSNSDLEGSYEATGNHNASSTVVYNDYYDGSQDVNGADDTVDEDGFDTSPWQVKPVASWDDQDVIDWLQAVKLDYFVAIFEGCGIDGDYLIQVNESDLIELDIEEEDVRKKFLAEVEKLKKRPKPQSVLKLQEQHSVRRKVLEEELNTKVSGELEELLKLQEDQECRIDASIAKLKEEQKRADELISHNQKSMHQSPQKTGSSSLNSTATSEQNSDIGAGRRGSIITPPVTFINDLSTGDFEKPVTEWTDDEVLMWLDVVGLGKHEESFKSKHITGKHLAEIDLQLLEDMNIKSSDDREEVLSKVYELFNPPSGVQQDQLMDEAKQIQGYEREKYMAAVSALKSQDSVQLPPPSTSNSSTNSSFKSVEGKPTTNKPSSEDSKKKSSGLSKLKDVISPKKKSAKDSTTVQIWFNINQPDKSKSDSYEVTESTTTEELIDQCLDDQELIEDHRLYCIVEVPIEDHDLSESVPERELRVNEYPLKIQRSWPDLTSYRFEIRQRSGVAIKVMDRITGHSASGKSLTVSPSTPCYQVLQLALKKFNMKNVDVSLFCLLEHDTNGDIRLVQDMEIPAQLNSDKFILCDKANMENQMAITEDKGAKELRRLSSSNSQNSLVSSKMASIQLELSQNSDSMNTSLGKPSVDKYNDLEREALQEKLVELEMKVIELQDTNKMNTERVSVIVKENKRLQEKEKKLIVLQKTVSNLEENYRKQQSDMKQKMDLKNSEGDRDVLPLAVADLKAHLEQTTHEVQAKERQIHKLQQELKTLNEHSLSHSQRDFEKSTEAGELSYKIVLEESTLLTLMQKQALQFNDMEISKYQHQIEQEKKQEEERAKNKQQSSTLHSLLSPEEEYTVVAVEIVPGHYGYDFIVSSTDFEEEGVFVTSCDTNSVLKEGDRILEVNGISVCQASDAEVNTMLNSKMSARIVVLREQQPITNTVTTEDLASVKEDLSLAKEELQSERQQKKQLKAEMSRLQEVENKLNKKNQESEDKVKQLGIQLSDSNNRCKELESAVDDLQVTLAKQSGQERIVEQLQQQNNKLESEMKKSKAALVESAKRIHKLDVTCKQKENDLAVVTDERNELAQQLQQQLQDSKGKKNNSVVYLHDDDLPLWEVLKPADKGEILRVLRENVEESRRQKIYLDQLYALMIDQAPWLLEQMDEQFDEEDLSGDEEFC